MSVSHVAVAVNAREHLAFVLRWKHFVHEIRVAVQARALRHAPIARLDLNRLVKVLQRERQRMKKSVVSLRDPFADRMVRQVTVVADGHMPMAGILPGVVVILHDVAVGATLRIVAQVADALAVAKGKNADAR